MTLKQRVNRLENQTDIRPSYAQTIMRLDQEREVLDKKLDSMTEQQVIQFVLAPEEVPRDRETALKRLSPSDLMAVPVKKTILELKQIKLADYRERVKNRTGRWRELYLRECESLESAIWELQNEQEAH
jgi:hypothetical protein